MANPISRRTLLRAALTTGAAVPLAGGVAYGAQLPSSLTWDPIDKFGESIVSTNLPTQPKPILQNSAHQHGPITSHLGWQYAAFYHDAGEGVRHLALARRQLPSSEWEVVEFTDYEQTLDDEHRVPSIGVSPRDGTLHVIWDLHCCSFDDPTSPLTYRRSVPGLLTRPEAHAWTVDQFGPIQTELDGPVVDRVTYPKFVTAPNGKLVLGLREGTAADGSEHLYEYNGASGKWTKLGMWLSGEDVGNGTRGMYPNGFTFDNSGRLHVTWCWRNRPAEPGQGAQANHDLMYAYSDNNGRTWNDNNGELVAVTGKKWITQATPGVRVWEIPQGRGMVNTEGQTVDVHGRVHTVMKDDLSGTRQFVHYFRDTEGTWHKRQTGFGPAARTKLATDQDGNVFAAIGFLRIIAASAASGYNDWQLVEDTDHNRFEREPLIDPHRIVDGVISVLYQELDSPRLFVLDYSMT